MDLNTAEEALVDSIRAFKKFPSSDNFSAVKDCMRAYSQKWSAEHLSADDGVEVFEGEIGRIDAAMDDFIKTPSNNNWDALLGTLKAYAQEWLEDEGNQELGKRLAFVMAGLKALG